MKNSDYSIFFRLRTFWLCSVLFFILLLPGYFIVQILTHGIISDDMGFIFLTFCMAAIAFCGWRYSQLRCPRCGEQFWDQALNFNYNYKYNSGRVCSHCSLGENKKTTKLEHLCHRHRDREAERVCYHCRKWFCFRCLTKGPGNYYCNKRKCLLALKAEKSISLEANKGFAPQFVKYVAKTLMVIGMGGFLLTWLSAAGGVNWLPPSFEWPVGYSDKVIETGNGLYVVPLPCSRIQVYDPNWKFMRSWYVDAGGGSFVIVPSGQDEIDVYTSRGTMFYSFNTNGVLVNASKYYDRISVPNRGMSFWVPTSPWLLVFTGPFISLFVAVLGNLLLKFGKLNIFKKRFEKESI